MVTKQLPTEGTFQCPHCWQKYEVPGTPVPTIAQHLLRSHGEKRDTRWIRRRLVRRGQV